VSFLLALWCICEVNFSRILHFSIYIQGKPYLSNATTVRSTHYQQYAYCLVPVMCYADGTIGSNAACVKCDRMQAALFPSVPSALSAFYL